MIQKDVLENLAIKNQVGRIHVFREYCQHVALSIIYKHELGNHLLFKGGTALRFAYQSPRYSEDLDFSIFDLPRRSVEDVLLHLSEGVTAQNIACDIEEAKETSGGYFAAIAIKLYEETVHLSIQASQRKKNGRKPDLQLISNELIAPYTLFLLPKQELVEEKVQAALTRAKPRDFFDVYYLLRRRDIPVSLRSMLAPLPDSMKKKRVEFRELTNFLPKSMAPLVANFPALFTAEVRAL